MGPEQEPDWKEEDDNLRLSDDEEEAEPQEHYGNVTDPTTAVGLLMEGPEPEWKDEDDKLKLSDDEETSVEEDVDASSLSAAAAALRAMQLRTGQSVVDMLMSAGQEQEEEELELDDNEADDFAVASRHFTEMIERLSTMEIPSDSDEEGYDETADDFEIISRQFRSASRASKRDARNARMRAQGFFSNVTSSCFSGL